MSFGSPICPGSQGTLVHAFGSAFQPERTINSCAYDSCPPTSCSIGNLDSPKSSLYNPGAPLPSPSHGAAPR
jgi:hypothetical protein